MLESSLSLENEVTSMLMSMSEAPLDVFDELAGGVELDEEAVALGF